MKVNVDHTVSPINCRECGGPPQTYLMIDSISPSLISISRPMPQLYSVSLSRHTHIPTHTCRSALSVAPAINVMTAERHLKKDKETCFFFGHRCLCKEFFWVRWVTNRCMLAIWMSQTTSNLQVDQGYFSTLWGKECVFWGKTKVKLEKDFLVQNTPDQCAEAMKFYE